MLSKIKNISRINNGKIITGAIATPEHQFEGYRNHYSVGSGDKKTVVLATEGKKGSEIDVSWLKSASESFDISPSINDYVLVDVPIVTVSLPNRNMQAFPYEEVSYFDPMGGMQVYKSFVGKATHIDHDNQDPLKAKGIIFDASLEYVKAYDIWKIKVLTGWDRTKDEHLVGSILRGIRNGYSMGASVLEFICSIPNCQRSRFPHACEHLKKNFGNVIRTSDGKDRLVYENMIGVLYFEVSSVSEPADHTALSDDGIYR